MFCFGAGALSMAANPWPLGPGPGFLKRIFECCFIHRCLFSLVFQTDELSKNRQSLVRTCTKNQSRQFSKAIAHGPSWKPLIGLCGWPTFPRGSRSAFQIGVPFRSDFYAIVLLSNTFPFSRNFSKPDLSKNNQHVNFFFFCS